MATTITYTLTAEQEQLLNQTLSGFTTGKTLDNAIGPYINEALNKMVNIQTTNNLQKIATTFKDTTMISTLSKITLKEEIESAIGLINQINLEKINPITPKIESFL